MCLLAFGTGSEKAIIMEYAQFTPNPRKNKHLNLTERVKIELMTNDGKTPYVISKVLNCPIITILGELKRGTVNQIKVGKTFKIYLADTGQARYEENRKSCCRKYQTLNATISSSILNVKC